VTQEAEINQEDRSSKPDGEKKKKTTQQENNQPN
jgi:hypothetical protein